VTTSGAKGEREWHTTKDEAPRGRWRFDLSWGELEVFAAGDPILTTLASTAAVLARLHDRFRPALLHTDRWLDTACAAVWPANRSLRTQRRRKSRTAVLAVASF
jgi:hypothetical protein